MNEPSYDPVTENDLFHIAMEPFLSAIMGFLLVLVIIMLLRINPNLLHLPFLLEGARIGWCFCVMYICHRYGESAWQDSYLMRFKRYLLNKP